jgi:hypothetical protein
MQPLTDVLDGEDMNNWSDGANNEMPWDPERKSQKTARATRPRVQNRLPIISQRTQINSRIVKSLVTVEQRPHLVDSGKSTVEHMANVHAKRQRAKAN